MPEDVERYIFVCNSIFNMLAKDDKINELKFCEEEKKKISKFLESIYYRLSNLIFIPKDDIYIQIRDSDNKLRAFNLSEKNYDLINDLKYLEDVGFSFEDFLPFGCFAAMIHFGRRINLYHKESSRLHVDIFNRLCQENEFILCVERTKEIEIFTIIHLPIEKIHEKIKLNFSSFDMFCGGIIEGYCIDGIVVGELNSRFYNDKEKQLIEEGMIVNYIGKNKPILSVDRTKVISVNEEVIKQKEEAINKMLNQLVRLIENKIRENSLEEDNRTLSYLNSYLKNKYSVYNYFYIMKQLSNTIFSEYKIKDIFFKDFFKEQNLEIEWNLMQESRADSIWISFLFNNAKKISVRDTKIYINLCNVDDLKPHHLNVDILDYNIFADDWNGMFREYDAVSFLWPLIPQRLFKYIDEEQENDSRIKVNSNSRSGAKISDIMKLDSVKFDEDRFSHSILFSDVKLYLDNTGEENVYPKCYLDNIKDEDRKKIVLFVYICPREVHSNEKESLKEYMNNQDYMKGIEEGWSILFYRFNNEYIIIPGIVSREDILKKVPDYAKMHNDEFEYYFSDGTKAF